MKLKKIELNGKSVSSEFVKAEQLSLYNTWKIFLEQPTSEKIKNNISTADKSSWFAPELDSINEDKNLNIFMSSTDKLINGDNSLTQTNISLERLNKLINSDSELNPFCWSMVNKDKNNNISYPSPMKWNTDDSNYYEITANMMINKGGQLVDNSHFQNWGTVNDEILIEEFYVKESGWYLINSVFSNGNGPVNTGISCAVKKIEITSEDKNIIDQHCYLFMPQSGRWDRWDTSSFGKVFLKKV